MRKKIVAGNWKMNTGYQDGKSLASEVIEMTRSEVSNGPDVWLFPPFTHLAAVVGLTGSSGIQVGAQNCAHKDKGAWTGEISASMVASTGASGVLIGHSERREYFNESEEVLIQKMQRAFESELQVLFCCGEPLEERENGKEEAFVANQLEAVLGKLTDDQINSLVIAYEPIWAIGTGKTATAQEAQTMHAFIRNWLRTKAERLQDVPILYGGSVKPGNASEIFSMPDVDGGLVGGASLDSRGFVDIVKALA